jgi:hypothetical protein
VRSRALTALATVLVVGAVLLFGSAAAFDFGQRTAYALGIATATFAFMVADWITRWDDNRRG